jgi:hypothetical protein
MSKKTPREVLDDYTTAARNIELAGAAINVLEMMNGAVALRCINALNADQQRWLTKLDAAADRLGAPYPGSKP